MARAWNSQLQALIEVETRFATATWDDGRCPLWVIFDQFRPI